MHIPKSDMSQAVLHDCLEYDPHTGYLTWKKKISSKTVIGQRAGSVSKRDSKRVIRLFGELYMEHRIIWLYVTGSWPQWHIDHIDHNEQNNRFSNLRDVPPAVNNRNSSKRSDNTTGHVGVWINKLNSRKKYMAELTLNGERCHYSSHYTLQDAVAARKQAERDYGFHVNHGIAKP